MHEESGTFCFCLLSHSKAFLKSMKIMAVFFLVVSHFLYDMSESKDLG